MYYHIVMFLVKFIMNAFKTSYIHVNVTDLKYKLIKVIVNPLEHRWHRVKGVKK